MGGSALAQIITLAVTPVLARIYPPSAFGFLALVLAVAIWVAPAASLKLESAYMIETSRPAATALLAMAALSSCVIAVVTAIVLEIVFRSGGMKELAELPFFSAWAGVTVFLTALFSISSQAVLRKKKFGVVASRNIAQSAGTAVAQLGLGIASASGGALIGGYALGRTLGILPLFLVVRRDLEAFSLREAGRVLRKYWRYPMIFTPSAVLNGTALALPVLLIGIRFSVEDAGQWGMADRILAIPVVLVGAAVGQVVEAQIAERIRDGARDFVRYYLRTSAYLFALGFVIFVGGILVLPVLVPLYLGPGWLLATEIMVALLLMTSLRLATTPLSKIFLTFQMAKTNLALDLLRVVVLVFVFLVTLLVGSSIITTAWSFSISMSVVYGVSWVVGLLSVRAYARMPKSSKGAEGNG